jgi:hypothetical protein
MATPEIQTNKDLVEQKLGNYKAFLRANSTKPETVDEMDAYTIDHFLVFGAMNLMPLAASGQMGLAVDKTVERYHLKDDATVKDKVKRYYEFLIAFLESVKSSHRKRE